MVNKKCLGSDFNEFYIEAIENYTEYLEQKLKDIECGDCYKNMLECRCDNLPKMANKPHRNSDWRDEKPKYIIKLFGNGRWQMEGS